MKVLTSIALSGLAMTLAGCTTSSKVQEMIDASSRDQTDQLDSHGASIDMLNDSATAGQEEGKEHAEQLDSIETQLLEINEQVKLNESYAEAAKLLGAANTVKAAKLDELLKENTAADEITRERLMEIDRLYEETLMAHYQMMADSALSAIESLKSDGWISNTNALVEMNEPIEIIGPMEINDPEELSTSSNAPATNVTAAVIEE